jgi:D-alanyl-D-alanine carboxypeptidase
VKKGFAVLSVILLMTLAFLPFRGKAFPFLLSNKPEISRVVVAEAVKPEIVKPKKVVSLENYITRLKENGAPTESQAVLLQTLDGKVLAENNADTPLNPASVMKLSVSYLALKHYGPDHKFKTIAYTTGLIDESKQVLYGDLVIETEGDPNFTVSDANSLADSVRSQGIKRVEGTLIIKGPLLLRHTANPEYIYGKLKAALKLKFSTIKRFIAFYECT